MPLGVVHPRSRQEVVEAVRICREHDAPILARGGGTSLAGQGCNVAVCIDFSRHLHRVLEVDRGAKRRGSSRAAFSTGCRSRLAPHGLTFGPDPATHDHNTLGGMIGNDSCGVHSVKWGRTADNVERLRSLTYDGSQLELGPTAEQGLERRLDELGARGDIYRGAGRAARSLRPADRGAFPKIPRLVSGFEGLAALLPGERLQRRQAR